MVNTFINQNFSPFTHDTLLRIGEICA